MVTKISWFIYIPAVLIAIVAGVLHGLGIQLPFLGVSYPYLVILVALVVFVISFILAVCDRKISSVYIIKRNIPVAIFSVLTATFVASKSVLTLVQMFANYHDNDYLKYFIAIFGIFTSVSLVLVALAHFQGNNYKPQVAITCLSMPLWTCLLLVSDFMGGRKLSIHEIDPTNIFLFAFIMMYFLNLSMLLATVEGKKPTKNCFIYGWPSSVLSAYYGVNTIFNLINYSFDYSNQVLGFAFIALAVYIVLFNIELTFNVKSIQEQTVLFDIENDELDDVVPLGTVSDDFIIPGNDVVDYENQTAVDYNDFITTVTKSDEEDIVEVVERDDIVTSVTNYSDNEAIYVSKYFAEEFENNLIEDGENSSEQT